VEAGSPTTRTGRHKQVWEWQRAITIATVSFDIFKTHFSDDLPALYKNSGRGFFDDASRAAGFDHTRYVEWGTGLVDFDNDGCPTSMIATGNVYPEVEKIFKEYPYRGPRLLYQNLGTGRFKEVTAQMGPGILSRNPAVACAFGDFDNDGDIDVFSDEHE